MIATSFPLRIGPVLVAALGAGMMTGVLALFGPVPALGLLALAGAILLLVVPGLALPLLVLASALNRFGYAWGDTQIRLEILVGLLISLVVANRLAVRTVPWDVLRAPVVRPLLAYTLINVVSTIFFARELTRGLKLDAEIGAALLIYVVVVAMLWNGRQLAPALRALWVVTVGEAALGLALAGMYVVHLSTFGIQFDPFGLPMVFGTQWEANIFGSYLLGNFFLLLADYFAHHRSRWYLAGLMLIVAGIGVSMTRTVWLALILGALLFGLLLARARHAHFNILPIFAAVSLLALGGLILGSATPLAGRLADLINLQSSSASGRIIWFEAALSDWVHHPLLGSGTGSFNYGAVPGAPHPWLPNLFLLTLHDTGLIGLAILILLLASFYRYVLPTLRTSGPAATLAAGAVTGVSVLVLAFQTTSGFWFAYPWILVGLGVAIARQTRLRPHAQ